MCCHENEKHKNVQLQRNFGLLAAASSIKTTLRHNLKLFSVTIAVS